MAIRAAKWISGPLFGLVLAGGLGLGAQPATAGDDNTFAPIQRRYSCTTVPGGATNQRVCDARGVCRYVQVQGPPRRVCTQINR